MTKNFVEIIGFVGHDPKRSGNGDTSRVRLSVATNERWRDSDSGEKRERTEWHTVIFWNRLADIAADYVRKGSHILVSGAIKSRQRDGDRPTGKGRRLAKPRVEEIPTLDFRKVARSTRDRAGRLGGKWKIRHSPRETKWRIDSRCQPATAGGASGGAAGFACGDREPCSFSMSAPRRAEQSEHKPWRQSFCLRQRWQWLHQDPRTTFRRSACAARYWERAHLMSASSALLIFNLSPPPARGRESDLLPFRPGLQR